MKLFLSVLVLLLFCPAFAIDWVPVNVPSGRVAYLDKDSITHQGNYYFYNIKMQNVQDGSPIVVTIQSQHRKPLSATLKVYKEAEYKKLEGDYSNITNLKTLQLQPVTYDSLVYACFKKVKRVELAKKSLEVNFEEKID